MQLTFLFFFIAEQLNITVSDYQTTDILFHAATHPHQKYHEFIEEGDKNETLLTIGRERMLNNEII